MPQRKLKREVVQTADNLQSIGEGQTTPKCMVISDFKGSNTSLLSKVKRKMKLRLQKLISSIVCNPTHSAISKPFTNFFKRGVSLNSKIKYVCISQTEVKGFCNFLEKKSFQRQLDDISPMWSHLKKLNAQI